MWSLHSVNKVDCENVWADPNVRGVRTKGLERARKDGTPPRETRAFDYKEFPRLALCDFIGAFFELCEEKLSSVYKPINKLGPHGVHLLWPIP